MKLSLPWVLSANGGYVDAAGFLALHGLFTTHVTGNFVTLGASLVLGSSGALAKLIALPLFCVVVFATRWASSLLSPKHETLRSTLVVHLILLVLGAALAIRLGPFADGDAWPAIATGMTLVAAMAVQNAIHRIHLGHMPPSTIMTGSTTQLMIDLADMSRRGDAEAQQAARARAARLFQSILAFAAGCAAAALFYARAGVWCFALPPLLGALAVVLAPAKH